MKKLVLVLALLLSATIPALSQTPIQSRVVDLNGAGVPDVTIIETVNCTGIIPPPPPGPTMKTYVTDANGNFTWPQLNPPGGGSSCASTLVYTFGMRKDGYAFTRASFYYKPYSGSVSQPADDRIPLVHATTLPTWALVSAASYTSPTDYSPTPYGITSEMIIAGFGSNLATSAEFAQGTLPTTLAGRKILVKSVAIGCLRTQPAEGCSSAGGLKSAG